MMNQQKTSLSMQILNADTRDLYPRLVQWFDEFPRVLVAFSAGVDSTLVLKAAADSKGASKVTAITARSPSLRSDEFELSTELCKLLGVAQLVLDTNELSNPLYQANRGDRCYFCK
ncbi:MAG: 7-cyano-7-deazaguanine synthase, partial [Bdellovibrionales bacterium]|nr:7-cyano-7-deazaguanine synthase [Bdellovibrionales bacterium]